ncbi:MAG: hypothetical protein ACOYBY_14720 [Dermatophilaceae bacterium]
MAQRIRARYHIDSPRPTGIRQPPPAPAQRSAPAYVTRRRRPPNAESM